ncbi:MAG: DUF6691 family protein [Anderseniella sp.]
MRSIIALISGLVFGLGLVISDMINPARVLAFLDVFGGAWDPTLAFVMAGAMSIMALAWVLAGKRQHSVSGSAMPGPASETIDLKLIGGAGIFGIGWGLAGLCPGPALAASLIGGWPVWLFISAMLAGMVIFNFMDKS